MQILRSVLTANAASGLPCLLRILRGGLRLRLLTILRLTVRLAFLRIGCVLSLVLILPGALLRLALLRFAGTRLLLRTLLRVLVLVLRGLREHIRHGVFQ